MWLAGTLALALGAAAAEPIVAPVAINGVTVSEGEILWHEGPAPRWWVSTATAESWRLETGERARRRIGANDVIELCADAAQERCDYREGTLRIEASPERFRPLVIGASPPPTVEPVPTRQAAGETPAGAYLNYDLSIARQERWATYAFLEGHLFRGQRSAQVRLTAALDGTGARIPQLDGQVRFDDPDHARAWSIGSIQPVAEGLRGPISLVGLHVGRDFALQPDTLFIDRPSVLLATDRPINAEVTVDQQRQATAEIPYGTYLVEAGTGLPGRGELQVIATDRHGDRRVTRIAYYHAPQLLATGTTDWSLDVGIRQRDPLVPRLTGDAVAAAAWSRGFPGATLRTQVVADAESAAGAVALDWKTGLLGISTVALDAGRAHGRTQARVTVGHEYIGRSFNVSARAQQPLRPCVAAAHDGAAFEDFGACRRVQVAAGLHPSSRFTIRTAYNRLEDRRSRVLRFASIDARWDLDAFAVTLGLRHVDSGVVRETAFAASVSMPLGRRWRQVSASVAPRHRRVTATTTGPISDDHVGDTYRMDAYTGSQSGVAGALSLRRERLEFRADMVLDDARRAGTIGVSGALVRFNGSTFAAAPLRQSFLLVDTGFPGVPVFVDRRPVGRSDAAGRLFVPHARPFERNVVSIDATALPIEWDVARDEITVVPSRGGALVRFRTHPQMRHARLLDPAGEPVPAGTRVQLSDGSLTVVGRQGRVELPADLAGTLQAMSDAGTCVAIVPDVPDGGSVECRPERAP